MAFTKDQLEYINTPIGNTLVSAAAGSGKTTTLAARVIHLLKDEGYSLEQLIILTFTDLAANEMKAKIMNALGKEKDPRIIDELKHIDEAYISTFDSFCNKFIKKYSAYSSFPKDFTIGDSILLKMILSRIINSTLRDYYSGPNVLAFDRLVEVLNAKNESQLESFFMDVYLKIDNELNPIGYLNSYMNKFYDSNYITKLVDEFISILRNKLITLNSMEIRYFNIESENDVNTIKEDINEIINTKDYNDLLKRIKNYKFGKKPNKPKDKSLHSLDDEYAKTRNKFKDEFSSIQKFGSYESIEDIKNSYLDLKDVTNLVIVTLKNIDNQYNDYKKSHSVYSFSDIQKECIKILESNKNIRDYFKNNIKEIAIDEYQDTNEIGNHIVSLISNNNVLVVGDIRQSIYMFRGAKPEIFANLMKDYESKKKTGRIIKLKENFRSRKEEVLDVVNEVFKNINDYPPVKMDYFNEEMIYGNHVYDERNDELNKFRVIFRTKDEDELDIVAKDIRYKLDSHQIVFDNDLKIYREITPKDVMVLSVTNSNLDDMGKALKKYSIPSMVYKDKAFVSFKEIIFLKEVLTILSYIEYNKVNTDEFNLDFISFLRNPILNINGDEIVTYLKFARTEGNTNLDAFKLLFSDIYDKFIKLQTILHNLNTSYVIKEAIKLFDVYNKLMSVFNYEEREIRINLMSSTLDTLSKAKLSLLDVMDYFEYIKFASTDIEIKQKELDNLDYVSCMTMHKSKGLEKPIVYLIGLSKGSKNSVVLYSNNYGINYKNDSSFVSKLINNDEAINYNRDKLRLLYVALTRARESNTIVLKDTTEIYNGVFDKKLKYDKLLSINNDYSRYAGNRFELNDNKDDSNDSFPGVSINPYKYVDLKIKPKEEIIKTHASHEVYQEDGEVYKALEYGNHLHYLFERCDFLSLDLELSISKLTDIDKEQTYLKNFRNQDIFNNELIREFHELKYYLDNENGIIDYMLETKDSFIIVDFKTKDISDPLYINQLNTYRRYVESRVDKPVFTYLYSIIDNILEEV